MEESIGGTGVSEESGDGRQPSGALIAVNIGKSVLEGPRDRHRLAKVVRLESGKSESSVAPGCGRVVKISPFAEKPATASMLANVPRTVSAYYTEVPANPTYPVNSSNPHGWVSPFHCGLNQGPIVLLSKTIIAVYYGD